MYQYEWNQEDNVARLVKSKTYDYWGLLQELGGYYRCPKDKTGKRLGPLVGYAGRDPQGRQYVGDVYLNFAKAEERPVALGYLTGRLVSSFAALDHALFWSFNVFCGAPMGGICLAYNLAVGENQQRRFVFPDKKVVSAATPMTREVSELVWGRHEIRSGDHVAIVEDVANNFSTTESMIQLIESSGGSVSVVVCFLNRSLAIDSEYIRPNGVSIPVVSLVRQPIPQYRQHDPEVAEDIASGNVVWKPKDDWPRLQAIMEKYGLE